MSASGVMGLRRRRWASRDRACDTRPLSTASGTAISQVRAGSGLVADRMTGVVRLSSREMPPEPEPQLGAPAADGK
jgi:hypothetical protein